MIKLAIEFENPAKLWWKSGGRELWDSIAYGFDGNEVLVDDDVARSWIARAATILAGGHRRSAAPAAARLAHMRRGILDRGHRGLRCRLRQALRCR